MGLARRRIGILFILFLGVLSACVQASDIPPACTAIGQSWVSPVDGMELVCIPSGDFLMGAAENDPLADPDERPQRTVFLDAFWIDRVEVTNVMFAQCVAAGACHTREYSPYLWGVRLPNGTPYYGEYVYSDYPVIMMDGDEAQAYCQWTGRRLPSEAEWEKAARGTDGRLFPWGAELDCEHASYLECKTGPVIAAAYPNGASPYGALNMSGNMWEWVADRYDANSYTHAFIQSPSGPVSGEYRTLRGGGWSSITANLRVTNRSTGKPEHSTDGAIGIRCALSGEQP